MKTQPHLSELLDDLLVEAASPGLRAALFEQTLRAVRQQKRRRQIVRRALSGLALVAALGWAVAEWSGTRPPTGPRPRSAVASASMPILPTRLLNAAWIVETKPGAVPVVSSVKDATPVLRTAPGEQGVKELDDQGLLNLLAGKPAALVRSGPNVAELIFADPADANGFPVP